MSTPRPLLFVLAATLLAALWFGAAPAAAHSGHTQDVAPPHASHHDLRPVEAPPVASGMRGAEACRAPAVAVAFGRPAVGVIESGHAGGGCRGSCCAGPCCTGGPGASALPATEGQPASLPAASAGVRQPERAAPASLGREAGLRPPRVGA